MTLTIHRLKKRTSMTVSSSQKNCLKCDVRTFTLWNWEKMGVILRCKLAMNNETNVKTAVCHFVANFHSYDSAKYYLNWFTVSKVITKIKRMNCYQKTKTKTKTQIRARESELTVKQLLLLKYFTLCWRYHSRSICCICFEQQTITVKIIQHATKTECSAWQQNGQDKWLAIEISQVFVLPISRI